MPAVRAPSAPFAEESGFDVDQDFTKQPEFDGLALAASCLVRLCEQGSLPLVAELLQAKADINKAEGEIGVPPLIAAASTGHIDICKYLIRRNACVHSTVEDSTKRTAMHAAAVGGFTSVVQLLLES